MSSGFSGVAFASFEQPKFCASHCVDPAVAQKLSRFLSKSSPAIELKDKPCAVEDSSISDLNSSPLARGGRKAMAMNYGSCDVLKLPVLEAHSWSKSENPYLEVLKKPGCDDSKACSDPVKWGIQGIQGNLIDGCEARACAILSGKTPVPGNAAFVSQSLAMAGARIKPNEDFSGADVLTTKDYWNLGETNGKGDAVDCFERVPTADYKAGDLIVSPDGHIAMVDTVGEDPFGIEANVLSKMNSSKGLQSLNRVIQSGFEDRNLKAPGFQLEQALTSKSLNGFDPAVIAYFETAAKVICEREVTHHPSGFKVTVLHSSVHHENAGVQRQKIFPGLSAIEGSGEHERYGQSSISTGVIEGVKRNCIDRVRAKWKSTAEKNPALAAVFDQKSSVGGPASDGRESRFLRYAAQRSGCEPDSARANTNRSASCVSCCDSSTSYAAQTKGKQSK